MMKICFFTYNLNTKDGSGRFSHDLVESLEKEGIEVTITTTENSRPLLNFLKIRKIIKNSNVIHAVDIWPNGFYARLISLGIKKPIIITALGTYSVASLYSWRRLLINWASNSAQIIAISNYTKEKILEKMPKLKIEVITPGFDLNFWSRTQNQQLDEEILKYKPYILSVGALKPRKGYVNSIKAFGIVSKKFEKLNYIIVGQGEDYDHAKELKKIVKENNLENKIFFVSSGIDDSKLLEFYRNAELFVLTPLEKNHHFEGFGIVYLEASASGLPIVATNNSGAISATKDSYNSILVPQNDPQKTVDAILKILSDNSLKENLKRNGFEWVKNFSQEKITAKYIKIYNDLASYN